MKLPRRVFMKGAGLGALLFTVNGKEVWLTAAQARSQRIRFSVLKRNEVLALQAFGDALLPGAGLNGITHFVDHQLAGDPADALLLIRHLDWPGPLADFYQQGLRALDAAAERLHGASFGKLGGDARNSLIDSLWKGDVEGWDGPPAPLFYLAVRSDAVDVVYGTVKGFEKLGMPYLPHITPPENW